MYFDVHRRHKSFKFDIPDKVHRTSVITIGKIWILGMATISNVLTQKLRMFIARIHEDDRQFISRKISFVMFLLQCLIVKL